MCLMLETPLNEANCYGIFIGRETKHQTNFVFLKNILLFLLLLFFNTIRYFQRNVLSVLSI